ncbi:MAG TPA: NAD-dependent DNA ligase LigA [Candidatus Evtepia faecavium]|nr:NAD-dependent DNA ligase LigA [Candidatus Evtepia faecavium]
MDPAQRAKQLREVLNHHSDLYYNQDAPEISDQEYDGLMRELKALEKVHPELITPDSPTQRVGGSAKRTAGVLVAHRVPMLSMQDLFTQEEVDHFISDCQEKLGEGITFLVETKIDGLSMALRYENGNLVTAITRGDGRTFGEDVTANAKVIDDVAVTLRHPIPYLELRGEVYMTDAAFEAVNERQELLGKKPFANPRNCAAGTLRQLDAAVTRERHLSFFVFNVQDIQGKDLSTHEEAYAYLKDCGVTVIAHYYVCKNREEIWKAIQAIGEMRGELPYDIDGAVIKVNDLALRAQLKDTAKNAGYQVAYKYPPEQKETVLREIELSVGRTGKITPTAIFDPVRLCGTTVSRCTLHNQDFITKLGICLGSTLRIEKSGEVIPKCVGVVPEKQPPDAQVFQIPMVCPVCGEPAVREDTADIKCVNLNCPAQLERLIGHFVGRNAMDIKGFGVVYVHDLIAEGYLKDVADIFTLAEHREALIQKGIVGKEKNTDKLLAAIEKAKANPPDRLLTGLGISNVGRSAAQVLMRHFGTLDALVQASEEEMMAIDDIGPISAHCVYTYFRQPHNLAVLQKLKAAGVNLVQEVAQAPEGDLPLFGKTVVISGTLPGLSREEAAALIQRYGGKVTGSVSKKTSFLLAGEGAGSKLEKAHALDIPVLSLEEVQAMLETAPES